MKKIKTEIAQYMTVVEASNRTITSRFVFPEEFLGFQGHFPGNKVLPGVCQIQCALAAVERATQRTVELKEVTLAKYFSPVAPGEEIVCTCSDVADHGAFTMKAVISKGATKISELKLRVVLGGTKDKA